MTQNVSCTGVLFRSEVPFLPSTPITLQLLCSPGLCGDSKPLMTAVGRVVRSVRRRGHWQVGVALIEVRLIASPEQARENELATLGDSAHRLVQLMTVIIGSAELLSHDSRDPERQKWLQKIREAASEAAGLVRSGEMARRRASV